MAWIAQWLAKAERLFYNLSDTYLLSFSDKKMILTTLFSELTFVTPFFTSLFSNPRVKQLILAN